LPVFISSVAFFSGLFIGKFIERRKSDRKFAGLVAERLMGKPSTEIVSVDSSGSWANANMQQQLGGLSGMGQSNLGMLGSVLGSNNPSILGSIK
jgi:hypothetical protein